LLLVSRLDTPRKLSGVTRDQKVTDICFIKKVSLRIEVSRCKQKFHPSKKSEFVSLISPSYKIRTAYISLPNSEKARRGLGTDS
jgi:hypothetical protein